MFKKIIALVIIGLTAYSSITLLMPKNNYINNPTEVQFSNKKAFRHVQQLAKKPHAIASKSHDVAMQYCINELEKLGLDVHIQEGNTFSNWATFAKVKNIVARIKGTNNTKALLIMTHYDSAGNTSYGASDAASGVAVILEGIRSFLATNTPHKNDIIILITDGEEIGLNGAHLFVDKHPWLKDIGLVLNFEARGSGGPSFALIETNNGNSALIHEFIKAKPDFPVANSLAYSIYKKLPNDTDLTVFRKKANIQGFNFAFIDDHFDYHSALDIPERLDNNTLSHQASYLMPLLTHFSNVNLNTLNSVENWVYFNSPLGVHFYPYSYILPLVIIAFILFILVFVYGKKQNKLRNIEIGKGFLAFFSVLIINGVIGFFGWKVILKIYPHYNEILQGFPYNGHLYILFFILLALSVCFYIYKKVYNTNNTKELLVAPIVVWLVLNLVISQILKGASFFIIPLFFVIGLWFFSIRKEKPSTLATTLLCFPALFILVPFIQQFPIALGLKIVIASTILISLLFGLLLPVLASIRRKKTMSYFFLLVAFLTFILAHFKSEYTTENPKPNSLVYLQDNSTNKNYWLSYDAILDDWNSPFFKTKTTAKTVSLNSKYHKNIKHVSEAPKLNLKPSEINIFIDTIINNQRNIRFCIAPKRKLNSIVISSKNKFTHFSINGVSLNLNIKSKFLKKKNHQIAHYFFVDNIPLEVDFSFSELINPELEILEISYDLLDNAMLKIPKRNRNTIPKPFIVTDAILVKSNIAF